jgi:hypothetical protein
MASRRHSSRSLMLRRRLRTIMLRRLSNNSSNRRTLILEPFRARCTRNKLLRRRIEPSLQLLDRPRSFRRRLGMRLHLCSSSSSSSINSRLTSTSPRRRRSTSRPLPLRSSRSLRLPRQRINLPLRPRTVIRQPSRLINSLPMDVLHPSSVHTLRPRSRPPSLVRLRCIPACLVHRRSRRRRRNKPSRCSSRRSRNRKFNKHPCSISRRSSFRSIPRSRRCRERNRSLPCERVRLRLLRLPVNTPRPVNRFSSTCVFPLAIPPMEAWTNPHDCLFAGQRPLRLRRDFCRGVFFLDWRRHRRHRYRCKARTSLAFPMFPC